MGDGKVSVLAGIKSNVLKYKVVEVVERSKLYFYCWLAVDKSLFDMMGVDLIISS